MFFDKLPTWLVVVGLIVLFLAVMIGLRKSKIGRPRSRPVRYRTDSEASRAEYVRMLYADPDALDNWNALQRRNAADWARRNRKPE